MMKMAKASEQDLEAAFELVRLVEGLTANFYRCIPAEDPEGDAIQLNLDNPEHGRMVIERLQRLFDRASLGRVVMGLAVLLDPRNKVVDPNANTLEFHPGINALFDSQAAQDVLAERKRQVDEEGWTHEEDDTEHTTAELASAAGCYALNAGTSNHGDKDGMLQVVAAAWPWDLGWWKPTTPRRDLVKAGALILAEIERLDRAEARAKAEVAQHD